jgi:hypothetical protein
MTGANQSSAPENSSLISPEELENREKSNFKSAADFLKSEINETVYEAEKAEKTNLFARTDFARRSLKANEKFFAEKGEIRCRCPPEPELRFICRKKNRPFIAAS